VAEKSKHVGNALWFLLSEMLGLLVALMLFAMAAQHVVVPFTLRALCPSSIIGSFADPANVWDKFTFAIFVFGGNFLLYGIIGTLMRGFLRPKQKINS
jgi:hypothetical protein